MFNIALLRFFVPMLLGGRLRLATLFWQQRSDQRICQPGTIRFPGPAQFGREEGEQFWAGKRPNRLPSAGRIELVAKWSISRDLAHKLDHVVAPFLLQVAHTPVDLGLGFGGHTHDLEHRRSAANNVGDPLSEHAELLALIRVIPRLPTPRLGLSVHSLSALQGVMFLNLGLVWPRLRLGTTASRIAYWTYLYSSVATLVPYVMAAGWGAGNTTIPLAAGTARGTAAQERSIKAVLYSAAPPFFVAMALILWGLRQVDGQPQPE